MDATPIGVRRRWKGCAAVLLAAFLAACATPADRFAGRAATLGFAPVTLKGHGFRHLAYVGGMQMRSDTLHVYVEHDGTPWLGPAWVAEDPTPRTPFALELMARDPSPRLLLGRPCYFEPSKDPGCGPLLWTHRRYSLEVVASMAAALRSFMLMHPYRRVVLVGHSGGGTIAWLMAAHVPETSAVVTIAANLDTDDWARIHGYSALEGSLNPASQPDLRSGIVQSHYVGSRDRKVPPSVVRSFARRHTEARVIEVAGFDHECCWIERWPQLIDEAASAALIAERPPG